jgi:U3 small nucleolar RNA-associated protein 5
MVRAWKKSKSRLPKFQHIIRNLRITRLPHPALRSRDEYSVSATRTDGESPPPAKMPAAVANLRGRNGLPPAKKAKLTQSPATVRQNGLKALVNGNAVKPTAQINGVKNAQANRVDDATAVVEGPGDIQMGDAGNEVIEISSNEEDSEDDEEIEDLTQAGAQEEVPTTNGNAEDEDGAEAEDLTFGDRLRAEGPEPVRESRIINVEDADPDTRAALTTTQNRSLAPPTDAHSLKTVLEQALRTNDTERLESCLSVIDAESVYATVERLESRFVGVLLQRLAERLHRKPGRAGILMAWVQYSLVSAPLYELQASHKAPAKSTQDIH